MGIILSRMNEKPGFISPHIDFDPRLAHRLAGELVVVPATGDGPSPLAVRRSPLNGYIRMLTPEGGILILYRDQDRNLFLVILRIFAWVSATGMVGWLLFKVSPLSTPRCLAALALVMVLNWFIVRRKIEVRHSVEIRADTMIVDGEDIFYAEDIGDHWPELQVKNDDPDRMVICGICGTRFVEYMTANRLDRNDRTPEVLAADLEAAMEQLWGRREVTFATAF
jgi:hypothetical protein